MEFMEEVGHSVSDKILSPAYKRFNSSSPLITLSDPAEAAKVSICVFVQMCVCVCNTLYTEEKREGESSVQSCFNYTVPPADL